MGYALVTGASSGLGWHYALELAKRGKHDLWLVARRKERLEQLTSEVTRIWGAGSNRTVRFSVVDLTDRSSRAGLVAEVEGSGIQLDLLVNNAGFGSVGPFASANPSREVDMVELNCVAPIDLCRAFIPAMSARGSGGVINVCSTCAYQAMPYMATYGATKAFLLSHSVALAFELKKTGIKVLGHCPGPTDSEFHLAAGLTDKLSHLPSADTRTVVVAALDAFERGKVVLINGIGNRILAGLARVLPRSWAAKIVAFLLGR